MPDIGFLAGLLTNGFLAAGFFVAALATLVVPRRYVLDRVRAWIERTKGVDDFLVGLAYPTRMMIQESRVSA